MEVQNKKFRGQRHEFHMKVVGDLKLAVSTISKSEKKVIYSKFFNSNFRKC